MFDGSLRRVLKVSSALLHCGGVSKKKSLCLTN
jgi:hypothetical protein